MSPGSVPSLSTSLLVSQLPKGYLFLVWGWGAVWRGWECRWQRRKQQQHVHGSRGVLLLRGKILKALAPGWVEGQCILGHKQHDTRQTGLPGLTIKTCLNHWTMYVHYLFVSSLPPLFANLHCRLPALLLPEHHVFLPITAFMIV